MKIVEVCAAPETFQFFDGLFATLDSQCYKVVLVAGSAEARLAEVARSELSDFKLVKFARTIDPVGDIRAILELARFMVENRSDLVHGHTPKGVLLGTLAGVLAGVPLRAVHLHGFPIETATGIQRLLLFLSDWLALRAATDAVPVGNAVRNRAMELGYLKSSLRVAILGNGSAGGVDCEVRFNPSRFGSTHLSRTACGPFTCLFLGRLTKDKGLDILLEAWRRFKNLRPSSNARLLIGGPIDAREPLSRELLDALSAESAVQFVGETNAPEQLYTQAHVVLFPSRREGLPYVPLEAGAMGLPVIASDLAPCREIVIDNETGRLFPTGDVQKLAEAITEYYDCPARTLSHGENARSRICLLFEKKIVKAAWVKWLSDLRREAKPQIV